jgi:hypothetical protein
MTATLYTLQRHHDVTGISGEGAVATICEFDDGHTVLHWDTATPSTTVYTDIRHITALHGHEGASTLEPLGPDRLLAAYQRIVPFLLHPGPHRRPVTCAPHPDHPDRLRLTLADKASWRFWTALLDGSTDTASHVEVNGEIEHTWISSDGNVWLTYYTPTATATDPLTTFDREDR